MDATRCHIGGGSVNVSQRHAAHSGNSQKDNQSSLDLEGRIVSTATKTIPIKRDLSNNLN
ncbi:MAG: hypothetical protein WA667_25300 [Candidatus Nitrosopolaris sp.]